MNFAFVTFLLERSWNCFFRTEWSIRCLFFVLVLFFFSVDFVDQSKAPRKAAIFKGKINDAGDRLVLFLFPFFQFVLW